MGVNEEELEKALRLLPKGILEDLAEERGLSTSGVGKDPFVEDLLDETWTDRQRENLSELLTTVEKERRNYGWYICNIDAVSGLDDPNKVESVKELLLENEATFGDNGGLDSEGFVVRNVSTEGIAGAFWTKNEDYYMDAFGDIHSNKSVHKIEFEIDMAESRLYIDTGKYPKVRGVVSRLRDFGFEFRNVNYYRLTNKEANEEIEHFVENLELLLREADQDDQSELGDFGE